MSTHEISLEDAEPDLDALLANATQRGAPVFPTRRGHRVALIAPTAPRPTLDERVAELAEALSTTEAAERLRTAAAYVHETWRGAGTYRMGARETDIAKQGR
ncbi:antitoxin (DNA-binding transcriptional repressor) of toxin-antitoxin stability system [Lipingzhangella halophila]|uniref:Antitoxin (DNA-binding transcriptional repressor) of toxin-antitoxin stability system n=1 Tax=Lipingzhangella halophila TaxID=1783352 RepID=A0A7W7W5Q2_9ACTN|nr:hypothetical protein [Lipingzhangella halophila]MBB4935472.1 antitoxin (DNA-binding transcriptional repressor) of toxin-antitoxin stability system [Lipingzhangella halophila]